MQTPEKITGNENIFKELGSLQEKVLFFIAANPENHKQAIQQGINHPTDQYGSISKAVDTLEKLGFIKAKKAISQKKVEIKVFRCTYEGVLYSLTKDQTNILGVLNSNQQEVEFCKQFRALYDVWGEQHFAIFLKDIGEFLPMIHNKGLEYAMPYLLMKIANQLQTMDPKIKERNVKEAIKQFPENKKMLKEMRKSIDELI